MGHLRTSLPSAERAPATCSFKAARGGGDEKSCAPHQRTVSKSGARTRYAIAGFESRAAPAFAGGSRGPSSATRCVLSLGCECIRSSGSATGLSCRYVAGCPHLRSGVAAVSRGYLSTGRLGQETRQLSNGCWSRTQLTVTTGAAICTAEMRATCPASIQVTCISTSAITDSILISTEFCILFDEARSLVVVVSWLIATFRA